MALEFGFEVGVAEDAFVGGEVFAVEAEEAAVEGEGWEEGEGGWACAGFEGDGGGGGSREVAEGGSHCWRGVYS